MQASDIFPNSEIVFAFDSQPQKEYKVLKDVILILMADDLTEKVEHSEIEIVLFYFSIAYFEIVEERNDHALNWFAMIEIQMIGVCIDKRYNSA